MFYGIGQLLADYARDANEDKTAKAVFSTVHTALALGAVAHNFRTAVWSTRRTQSDFKAAFPNATKRASEVAARARKAA